MDNFINRVDELALLHKVSPRGGLIVIYGRRRIGKTSLLQKWLEQKGGLVSQAIEASSALQLEGVYSDLKEYLKFPATPKSWSEFFSLLDRVEERVIIALDEFPYLVTSDPSLPSIVQRWLDHRRNKKILLILSGSSTQMMQDAILNEDSPLYGRASAIINLQSMSYDTFCDFYHRKPSDPQAFELFSLTGGIPRYWELLQTYRCKDALRAADELFFGTTSVLENEPRRVLSDEKVEGLSTVSVLEAIGRGANRSSEIAGRIGISQTSLSKSLELLAKVGAIIRDTPFGVSPKDSKRSIYRIHDPCLRFWFSVYSPFRSRWHSLDTVEKERLIAQHTGYVFEDFVRSEWKGGMRYWEPGLEFDCVVEQEKKVLTIIEVKWGKHYSREKLGIEQAIRQKFSTCALSKKYSLGEVRVIDRGWLLERV
jgi:AAA+ ATPase superfamily predicted ATPase